MVLKLDLTAEVGYRCQTGGVLRFQNQAQETMTFPKLKRSEKFQWGYHDGGFASCLYKKNHGYNL